MALLLLTSGAVLALTCSAFFVYQYVTFRRNALRELASIGEIVAANTSAALAFENPEDATSVLAALHANRRILRACLYDRRGHVFATYPADAGPGSYPEAPRTDGFRFAEPGVTGSLPVLQADGTRLGTLYIEAEHPITAKRLQGYAAIALLDMAACLAVAYLLASVLQRQISRPVQALTGTAQTIAARRDYSVRAVRTTEDELGQLTDAFNSMLDQIEEQTRALRKSEQEVRELNLELEQRVQRRTEQLEAANRELETFSYSVSHDLRAPLRHVGGYVEMLTAATAGQLSGKALRYLNTITEATLEMGRLIDDLLAFSRMGRAELSEERVSLDALVESVVHGFELAVRGREIRWKIETLPDVIGDASVLKQVLTNLIDNALKYSRGRAVTEIEIGCAGQEGERVILFVRDNGAGFDMRYVHKLFGIFQRLHRADEFEGTGIGLASVQRIIGRHGGRTWAEGELGKGATIYFTLQPAHATGPRETSWTN
jgi:signal transduction histidine kinase